MKKIFLILIIIFTIQLFLTSKLVSDNDFIARTDQEIKSVSEENEKIEYKTALLSSYSKIIGEDGSLDKLTQGFEEEVSVALNR